MKEKDIFAFLSARSGTRAAVSRGWPLVAASLAGHVNAMPGLRSNVVALLVADGHHPYPSWVASVTRAP
jgi:hypothetical protein